MNPSPLPAAPTAAPTAAWQAALAAEHEAIFGYDVLGPRLRPPDQPLARRSQNAHRALRDAIEAQMATQALVPVTPLADYPALYPVTGPSAALTLAVRLEDNCAGAWRYVYLRCALVGAAVGPPALLSPTSSASGLSSSPSSSPAPLSTSIVALVGALRSTAQEQLTASAVRATRWRALVAPDRATVAFPGL